MLSQAERCSNKPSPAGYTIQHTAYSGMAKVEQDLRTWREFQVQLLIKSVDKTQVRIANLSDLIFSTFFASDDVNIEVFDYDSDSHTLYWANQMSPAGFLHQIRQFSGFGEWTTFSTRYRDSIVDLKVYEAGPTLYWVNRKRQLKEGPLPLVLEIPIGVFTIPKDIQLFIIDQTRRYLYCFGDAEIFRMGLFAENYIPITRVLSEVLFGFTMDEKAQLLYWSEKDQRGIFWHDVQSSGSGVLAVLDDMYPVNLIFSSGWLIWLNLKDNNVCMMRAKEGAAVEFCSLSEPDRDKYDDLSDFRRMALWKVASP